MTIEIRELIIQARIEDGMANSVAPANRPLPSGTLVQEEMMEQIIRQVLRHLREEQEGWR